MVGFEPYFKDLWCSHNNACARRMGMNIQKQGEKAELVFFDGPASIGDNYFLTLRRSDSFHPAYGSQELLDNVAGLATGRHYVGNGNSSTLPRGIQIGMGLTV